MVNVFDPAAAPSVEPERLVVGDRVTWRKLGLASDYPSTEYSLAYISRAASGAGNHEFQVPGVLSGSDYVFTIASADSADFDAGRHHWQLEVTRTSDAERAVILTGLWDIIEDLDNNVDPRSHAEIMVDKIEAVLQNRADADVLSYSINGRSLSKMPPSELMEWRDYYRREVVIEYRKAHARTGRPHSGTVKIRF